MNHKVVKKLQHIYTSHIPLEIAIFSIFKTLYIYDALCSAGFGCVGIILPFKSSLARLLNKTHYHQYFPGNTKHTGQHHPA